MSLSSEIKTFTSYEQRGYRENAATRGSSYQSLLYLEIHASNLFHYFLFFFEHLQQGRTRDKLDVMPFPAGAMHYRMG